MALKEDAKYHFSTKLIRVTPLNDDLSQTEKILKGGVGPFDFSATVADIDEVPFISKIDATAAETVTIDLSGAVSTSAVTVAELFAAINAATPTSIAASKEALTDRLLLTFATGTICQAYGEAAILGEIGQGGIGVRVVTTDTMKSFSETPLVKDEETFTTTDANGQEAEMISDGYRKGTSGSYVDASTDYLMRAVFEGGTYNEATGGYAVPTSAVSKIYFKIEIFHAIYKLGTHKDYDIDSYGKITVYSAKGGYGESTRDRNFTDANYTYKGTSPAITGDATADTEYTPLTIAEYAALDLENISA